MYKIRHCQDGQNSAGETYTNIIRIRDNHQTCEDLSTHNWILHHCNNRIKEESSIQKTSQ